MSILILERPDKLHLYSGNTSKFNAVHNVIQYKLQRRDYSILYGVSMEGSLIGIVVPKIQADESGVAIGDQLYVSTINQTANVVNIGYYGIAFALITIDVQISGPAYASPGYANNLTKRRLFGVEAKLFVYNNKTNLIDVAAVFKSYPDTKGDVNLIVNEYLKKYITNTNASSYTGTNYNDINAWCKFYIGYRSVWESNDNESFYEDRVIPYLGSNMLTNGSFDIDLAGWDTDDFIWNNGKATRPVVNISPAYIRPANYATFPTVAGSKYRISFKVSDVSGSYSGSNKLQLYFSDEFFTTGTPKLCPLAGSYTFDFTAINDGDFPTWATDPAYYVSLDNIQMQIINDTLDNTPIYRYTTKSALQIHSKYNGNLALHDAHFDTMDTLIKRAKFICDFGEPTRWPGFPFDIAVLFDESMVVSDVKRKEELYNYNAATGINEYTLTNKKAGEQRIHLFGTYTSDIQKVKIWLEVGDVVNDEYVDEEYVDDDYMAVNEGSDPAPAAEEGEVTERRMIRLGGCCENPVYLSWKGSAGGWSYYLFGKTQGITLSTNEQSIAQPYVDNLDVTGNKYQIDINSVQSMTMGCSNIDLNDVQGIMRMLDSGCIRIYLGLHEVTGLPEWEDVIVKTGSFKVYETGNARHDIEFTVENPTRYTHSA